MQNKNKIKSRNTIRQVLIMSGCKKYIKKEFLKNLELEALLKKVKGSFIGESEDQVV